MKSILHFLLFFPLFFSAYSQKVLLLGLDGVRSDALVQAKTPNLDLLMNGGLYSLSSWHLGKTKSGPGWSSMLTGVWDNKHEVVDNEFTNANFDKFPFFPNRIQAIKPEFESVLVTGWRALSSKVRNAGWTREFKLWSDKGCKLKAIDELQNENPDFLMVHFNDADKFGHLKGFELENKKYIEAIESIDQKIGEILRTLYSRPGFEKEDWLILVATDHGGKGHGHGGDSVEERKIWFIASSPKLPQMEIEAIDPGSIFFGNNVNKRVANLSPVIVDIAATAIHHLLGSEHQNIIKNWELDGRSWLDEEILKEFDYRHLSSGKDNEIRFFNDKFIETADMDTQNEFFYFQCTDSERCTIMRIPSKETYYEKH